jgi:hypothetical protein
MEHNSILKDPKWNPTGIASQANREHGLAKFSEYRVTKIFESRKAPYPTIPTDFDTREWNEKSTVLEHLKIPAVPVVETDDADACLVGKSSYRRVPLQCLYNHPGNRNCGKVRSMLGVRSNIMKVIETRKWDLVEGKNGMRGILLPHKCPHKDDDFNYVCPGTHDEPCEDQGATIAIVGGGTRFEAIKDIIGKNLRNEYSGKDVEIIDGIRVPACLRYIYKAPDNDVDDVDGLTYGLPIELYVNPKHVGALQHFFNLSNQLHEDAAKGTKTSFVDIIQAFPVVVPHVIRQMPRKLNICNLVRSAVSSNLHFYGPPEMKDAIVRLFSPNNFSDLNTAEESTKKGTDTPLKINTVWRYLLSYILLVESSVSRKVGEATGIMSPFSAFNAFGTLLRVASDEELDGKVNLEMLTLLLKGYCTFRTSQKARILPLPIGPRHILFREVPEACEKYFRWYVRVVLIVVNVVVRFVAPYIGVTLIVL